MQTWFPCFFGIDLHAYSKLHGLFSFGKTSRPTAKGTGGEALLQVVYCEVKNWYISQANQVGYDQGGGSINYIQQLKSYSFHQVIFIATIKFYTFEKFFILQSDCYVPLTRYITLHWKMHFPAIYSMQNFDIFCPSDITILHIWKNFP